MFPAFKKILTLVKYRNTQSKGSGGIEAFLPLWEDLASRSVCSQPSIHQMDLLKINRASKKKEFLESV